MRVLLLAAALTALPPSGHAAGRVASAGICADQVVVPLVERSRIVGVSPQAADPAVSPVAKPAAGLPVVAPSAEALVMAGADTVVLNTFGDGKTQALLEKLGITVLRAPYDATLADIPASLRGLGTALEAEEAADGLALDVVRRLQAVAAASPEASVLAAYYRPDGGSAGRGTYVSEAMAAAGYRSLAVELGQDGWGRLDLETLVLHPPQAIVSSFFVPGQGDLRRLFGRHPVFRRLTATVPVVDVPGRLWGCGGWPVVTAAEHLAAQRPGPEER